MSTLSLSQSFSLCVTFPFLFAMSSEIISLTHPAPVLIVGTALLLSSAIIVPEDCSLFYTNAHY